MKKIVFVILVTTLLLFTSCSEQHSASAEEAVSKYITALAEKNKPRVVSLSCKNWEESAVLEVDALLSVGAAVSDLECKTIDQNDSEATVMCSGSLDLTYNDEVRAIDLSRRTYTVGKEDGQWRVCSYK